MVSTYVFFSGDIQRARHFCLNSSRIHSTFTENKLINSNKLGAVSVIFKNPPPPPGDDALYDMIKAYV